ncbi:MAG TPA: hypothetical protein VK737_08390 [Opitutales bacterium]|nr:hypothetical protein [Opitutales bacterium]
MPHWMRRLGLAALLLGAGMNSAHAQGDDLIVVNSGNGAVTRISPTGIPSTMVPRIPTPPLAIATDTQGNFYITSAMNASRITYASPNPSQSIFKVDKSGNPVIFATIDSPPGWLAFDSHGTLFVTSGPGQLYKVSPAGAVAKVDVHFPPTTSYVPSFCGLAFDDHGNLFASDGRNSIYKINPATGDIATFVSGLDEPLGLAFDTSGVLYVANNGNDTVSRISSTGKVSQYALVADPGGLAFDSAGNLFVASAGTDSIFKVDKSGAVSAFLRGGGLSEPIGLAFAHAITLGKLATIATTDTKPSTGLMIAFCAPAVIFAFGVILWLVFSKKEEE